MKILFVENRYKTALWELIGKMYQAAGHEILWIVQNPQFMPSFGQIHVMPFPKGTFHEKTVAKSNALEKIIHSNRGLNYFEVKSDDFIYQYDEEITQYIEKNQPDVVFGESTAFHELLVIKACKAHNIPFLHPSSSRYPSKRFAFYEYDSLTPFKGSGETFSQEEALSFIDRLSKREVKPDYMKKLKPALSKWDHLSDKVKLVKGFYQGEKYNTPSPFVKRKLGKINADRIIRWDNLAVNPNTIPGEFKVLYPMQMQPEANIDVWGYPNRNQTAVVREICQNLAKDEVLILKPNPKSKYEIDEELLDLIADQNIPVFAMHHASKMEDVWSEANLVITVTGTVSIECVFSNKPVAMLGIGIQTEEKNCVVLNKLTELRNVIDQVQKGTFPKLTELEKINFLNKLVATSYSGVIADGMHGKDELENPENIARLKKAFGEIIEHFAR